MWLSSTVGNMAEMLITACSELVASFSEMSASVWDSRLRGGGARVLLLYSTLRGSLFFRQNYVGNMTISLFVQIYMGNMVFSLSHFLAQISIWET